MRVEASAILAVVGVACHDGLGGLGGEGCGEPIECFPTMECRGGEVLEWNYHLVGCEEDCPAPRVAHECLRGCGSSPLPRPAESSDPGEISLYCVAGHLGAPCTRDDDCLPTYAVEQTDGTVVQEYLRCDGAACVATDPPVVDGWLEPCDGSRAPLGFNGVLENNCLVDTSLDECVATAQTIRCFADWHCPQGATCDQVALPSGFSRRVCRPGPRGAAIQLSCPPTG